MKPKSILEYERECRELAEAHAKHLALKEFDEEGKLGRYLLRARCRTGYMWAEVVVLRHGHLLVHGDCDAVIFGICGGYESARSVLYWMADASADYAQEKASRGSSQKIATTWEPEVARWYIDEWLREEMVTAEQAQELIAELALERGQHAFVEEVYDTTGDAELCSAGEVTDYRVFAAQAVLRSLCRELENRDMQAAARDWFRGAA